ncbi:MAG: DNA polymerase III subunit delta [Thermodesulfobacteriota bacterium]
MTSDLSPEQILKQLEKGRLAPVYLFYGPDEFRQEKILNQIRERFIPENARDFNLKIFYGGDAEPATIMDSARSLPFLASNRLVIVRRVENISTSSLENFLPYLDAPVPSSCLIFLSSKADFRLTFYKKLRQIGAAVSFRNLYENQVVPWIKTMAKEMGIHIQEKACIFLQELVGNQLRTLHEELEKLHLRHGDKSIGIEEIQDLAIYSRTFTIFELMEEISLRRRARSLSVLDRYLEEEGKDAAFQIIGMLNRQIRLIFQAQSIMQGGGRVADVQKQLRVQHFLADKLIKQSKTWSSEELERALYLLYKADGFLKTGSQTRPVLENLVLSLTGYAAGGVN